MSSGKSFGCELSPGVLSISTGSVLPGIVSSSAVDISALLIILPCWKVGSIWKVIVTVIDVPAAINGIGLFNVAIPPAAV